MHRLVGTKEAVCGQNVENGGGGREGITLSLYIDPVLCHHHML